MLLLFSISGFYSGLDFKKKMKSFEIIFFCAFVRKEYISNDSFVVYLAIVSSLVDYFRNIPVSRACTGLGRVTQVRHLAWDTEGWMEVL